MMSRIRISLVAACALLFATMASAQTTIQLGGKSTLTIKGFISATMFMQDQQFTFGNGQNAEWPTPPKCTVDCWFLGGDVRNTRLTLAFDGPKVASDWKVGGVLELDFFGGFNGTGSFAGQQPTPRLRLGIAEISNGSTTLQIGQQWSPLFSPVARVMPGSAPPSSPVSLSHIAFPLGYGSAGAIGWRFPGVFLYQVLTPKDSAVNAEAELAVMQNSWSIPGSTVDNTTAGQAGGPQYELRFNLGGKVGTMGNWSAYVVGHYDNKDLSGIAASGPHDKISGTAYEAGARFQAGPVMVQSNYYRGNSIGQSFGAISQFQNGIAAGLPHRDKIASSGFWGQVGVDFTPNWIIFGFYGFDDPHYNDLKALGAAARDKNTTYAGMLRWRTGPYALGFEYMHSKLLSGVSAIKTETTGQQLALSALFNF